MLTINTNLRPGVLNLAAQMSQVSQVPQASQTYNKLNNFGKNGKLVRSHEHGKPNKYHASSQILLVVVLVGKSNSGHVSSSPASVLPFYVLRQPDTCKCIYIYS